MHTHHICKHLTKRKLREGMCATEFHPQCVDGIIGNYLLESHLQSPRLGGSKYFTFLETVLPTFQSDGLLIILQDIWFQHDGGPAHCANSVCDYLTRNFGSKWIGKMDQSLGYQDNQILLSSFFLYAILVDCVMDFVARIPVTAGIVHEIPGILQNVPQVNSTTLLVCILAIGRNFEYPQ